MTTPNNTLNRTPLTSRQRDASLLNDSSNTSRNSNNNNNNSNSKWNGKNGSLNNNNNNNNNDDDDNNDDNERRRIYNDMPPLEADLPLSLSSTSLLLLSSLPSIPLPSSASSLLLSSFIPIIGHGGHHNVGSSVQLPPLRAASSSREPIYIPYRDVHKISSDLVGSNDGDTSLTLENDNDVYDMTNAPSAASSISSLIPVPRRSPPRLTRSSCTGGYNSWRQRLQHETVGYHDNFIIEQL
jgi:hypothetical protein